MEAIYIEKMLKHAFKAGWDARDKKQVAVFPFFVDNEGTMEIEFGSYSAALAARIVGPEEDKEDKDED